MVVISSATPRSGVTFSRAHWRTLKIIIADVLGLHCEIVSGHWQARYDLRVSSPEHSSVYGTHWSFDSRTTTAATQTGKESRIVEKARSSRSAVLF